MGLYIIYHKKKFLTTLTTFEIFILLFAIRLFQKWVLQAE